MASNTTFPPPTADSKIAWYRSSFFYTKPPKCICTPTSVGTKIRRRKLALLLANATNAMKTCGPFSLISRLRYVGCIDYCIATSSIQARIASKFSTQGSQVRHGWRSNVVNLPAAHHAFTLLSALSHDIQCTNVSHITHDENETQKSRVMAITHDLCSSR